MKKTLSLLLFITILISSLALVSCGDNSYDDIEFVETEYAGTTLYVYNWGEYIADGSDGSKDIIKMFEKKYDITVNYDYFISNEEMYTQIKNNASYDIIIPSDYMIDRLISEDLIQKIDFSNIPNYSNIADEYKNLYFDPNNEYSVPYNVGMVGIIYNKEMVDAGDADSQSWGLMWNSKYKNNVVNFNNSRDAFGTAQYLLGLDVNSANEEDWQAAYNKLLEQKSNVEPAYLMDEIYNKMENENAAIAAYYAGDCLQMMQENENLAFYYPTEGTNIFVDSMCIPTAAKNKGAAELFINFMLETDIAVENANYLCYASPNKTVWENENYDYHKGTDEYEILYNIPESYQNDPSKMQYFHDLSTEAPSIQALLTELWTKLGIE